MVSLCLANARKANPLSTDVMQQCLKLLEDVEADQRVRVVALRHEGSWFSSGHDLCDLFHKERQWAVRSREDLEHVFRTCSTLSLKLQALRQPSIAVVHGHASAGGLQLAASCDLIIAAEEALFSVPGSQRGRFCHTPGVALAQRVGRSKALEMLLLGSVLSAQEAERVGLVNFVVPRADLEQFAGEIAEKLATASRTGLQSGKVGFVEVQNGAQGGLEAQYRAAEELMVDCFLTPDAREGTLAMYEKRKPSFS